ncbi:MAG: His/Gly/Thr/Pro-type tRNA ligase C-terminal domain-containing protein, partial [Clostridia bacterium]|nr:His/Gly/Thr/Pro-type tRNA ligase C-terminal domain-containing protein [Clostridia bacterium]
DERAEKVGYKIREAVMEKVPYVVVVGEKDMNDKTVTVRKRRCEEQEAMSIEKFIERLNKEIDEKDPDVPKLGE